jgi:hypothetical protein
MAVKIKKISTLNEEVKYIVCWKLVIGKPDMSKSCWKRLLFSFEKITLFLMQPFLYKMYDLNLRDRTTFNPYQVRGYEW